MNSLIIFEHECVSAQLAVLKSERLRHFKERHDLKVGASMPAGIFGMNNHAGRGSARLIELTSEAASFELKIDQPALARKPITLIVAVPRPQTVKKIIHLSCVLGVEDLFFIRSANTEKSYLDSSQLEPEQIQQQLILGLEQACDSCPPKIEIHRAYKPFIEDVLPKYELGQAFLASPSSTAGICSIKKEGFNRLSLAIGPEQGFTQYESSRFRELGFIEISLGPRILRVEEACAYALGALSAALS